MKLCFPSESNEGVESRLSSHFGSAPFYVIVDLDTLESKGIANHNQHHAHGMCQPLAALSGEKFDGIVVGGIGMGALMKLSSAGVRVFKCDLPAVKDAIAAHKQGRLPEMTPGMTCGHGH